MKAKTKTGSKAKSKSKAKATAKTKAKTPSKARAKSGAGTDIYAELKTDHRKVQGLLNRLVKASGSDDSAWKGLIDQIRDELVPHSRAEEAVFYNPLRESSKKGADVVMHGYSEHAMAETELRTLQAAKMIDVNWTALAKKLRSDILHHVEEEEAKIFAAARKVFSKEEARAMGAEFVRMKPAIREQSLAGTTLDLVSNLLPQGGESKKASEPKLKKSA